MPTFWDAADRDDICRRVERLTPDATARWGKFTPAKMLAHLNDAMRMATGDLAVAVQELAAPLLAAEAADYLRVPVSERGADRARTVGPV